MTLVRIDSDAENTFVGFTADSLGINGLWLQANDQAREGVWVRQDGTQFWAGDDSGVAVGGLYNHWQQGAGVAQPNDSAPLPGEDCALLNTDVSDGYSWWDQECGETGALVCEKVPGISEASSLKSYAFRAKVVGSPHRARSAGSQITKVAGSKRRRQTGFRTL